MYQPPRHRRRRSSQSQALAFWAVAFGLVFFSYGVSVLWFSGSDSTLPEDVEIGVLGSESPSYEVQIAGTENYLSGVTVQEISEGESIRTGEGRGVSLTTYDGSRFILSQGTEVNIVSSRSDGGTRNIELELLRGMLWFEVVYSADPSSTVTLQTGDATVTTTGVTGVLSSGSLGVLGGSAQVLRSEESLGSVQQGQEVLLTAPTLQTAVLSVELQESSWYQWNIARQQDQGIVTPSGVSSTQTTEEEESSPSPFEAVDSDTESQTTQSSSSGEALLAPAPESDGSYLLTSIPFTIRGNAPSGAASVRINEAYVLQAFSPGDPEWRYILSTDFQNITLGQNRFEVAFLSDSGATLETREYLIVYDPEGRSAPLEILSHANGGRITTDFVEISGTVPLGVAGVRVNDYTLRLYQPGSGTFAYRMSADLGNRPATGSGTQIFEISTLDSSGAVLETLELSLEF